MEAAPYQSPTPEQAVAEKRLLRCSRYEHKVNGWKSGKSAAFMIVQKLHEHKTFGDFPSGKAVKVHRCKGMDERPRRKNTNRLTTRMAGLFVFYRAGDGSGIGCTVQMG